MKYCYETGMQDNISSHHIVSGGRCGEGRDCASRCGAIRRLLLQIASPRARL